MPTARNHQNECGLIQRRRLGIFRESPRRIDQIKKQICKTFNKNGLKITIEANKKVVNFLEVTLDLTKESYEPYTKPNNTPLYVHHSSNHPPTIIRNIPLAINRRLNGISSTREAFERAAPEHQRALNKSGYTQQLQYQTGQTADDQPRTKPPARHRKITWYSPPYSHNVATNVGTKFLNIVKESFKEGHPLKKIFNKNTLKLSYSCMPNLASKITSHNKSALEKTHSQQRNAATVEHSPSARSTENASQLTWYTRQQLRVTEIQTHTSASPQTHSRPGTTITQPRLELKLKETLQN